MAQGQVPYGYTQPDIDALITSLSPQRMTTYLRKANDESALALELYLYNVRLAEALLFPLNVAEITLRNAVDEALVASYGDTWHENELRQKTILNAESLNALKKAVRRARSNDRGKVVAELTFDFWSNLFRSEYGHFWRTRATVVFPNLEHGQGRAEIQKLARDITQLRNRVAHHEPLLDLNIPALTAKMYELTGLRCRKTQAWMRYHTTVNTVLRSKPRNTVATASSLACYIDRRGFKIVSPSTSLLMTCCGDARVAKAFVCVESDTIQGAFTQEQLMAFIASRAADLKGMVDLNEHTVSDLISVAGVMDGWRAMPDETPMMHVLDELRKPSIAVMVGTDEVGTPSGVILRAHRRY